MILEILEIKRNPTTVDKDADLFSFLIQVGIERSDDLDSLLTVTQLLNLDLFVVVEDSSDFDLLERIIALKLIDILCLAPDKAASVLGSNIDGSLRKERCSKIKWSLIG